MRICFSLAAAAALLAGAAPAAAQNWHRVGGDAEAVAYVDAASISGEGAIKRANVYTVYARPVENRLYAGGILSEFNCAENWFRTIEYSYYGAGGVRFETHASSRPNEHRTPDPGSFNHMFFRFVCAGEGGVAVGADAWSDAQAFLERAGRNPG